MKFIVAKRVYKDYDKLPKHVKELAIKQMELLKKAKSLSDLEHVKPLKGTDEPYYRLSFNDYRFVLYHHTETDTIEVVTLTHRKDTYKKHNLPWR